MKTLKFWLIFSATYMLVGCQSIQRAIASGRELPVVEYDTPEKKAAKSPAKPTPKTPAKPETGAAKKTAVEKPAPAAKPTPKPTVNNEVKTTAAKIPAKPTNTITEKKAEPAKTTVATKTATTATTKTTVASVKTNTTAKTTHSVQNKTVVTTKTTAKPTLAAAKPAPKPTPKPAVVENKPMAAPRGENELCPELFDGETMSAEEKLETVVKTANTFLAAPYKFGGLTPQGVDCSGLVVACYGAVGVEAYRISNDQARQGVAVEKTELKPGDVLFFSASKPGVIGHSALVVEVKDGSVKFIHATQSRGVRYDYLETEHWTRVYMGARRYL